MVVVELSYVNGNALTYGDLGNIQWDVLERLSKTIMMLQVVVVDVPESK